MGMRQNFNPNILQFINSTQTIGTYEIKENALFGTHAVLLGK
jgi:hypothetical protein